MTDLVYLEDEEGVVKGPHHYLLKKRPIRDLEMEAYRLLKERGSMPLSALWRRLNCHLWEAAEALRRLKERGLVEERDISSGVYKG